VNRFIRAWALAACLVLTCCGNDTGDDAARAACEAYGHATSGAQDPAALEVTAQKQAQQAAEQDDSFAALQRDLDDALSGAQALADAQSGGRPVIGTEMDAYFAADEQVRADCADAGTDIGPLRP
jgi:hypothetical protein